ncbi:MAG: biotin transporter BioY [Actinomycetia bacterium]|nr:biotin transporter BioY [Actinomycetes bacterium]
MNSRSRQLTVAALIAAALAVTSWIAALLPYAPLTLQTFFVVLAALLLRPRWAAASLLVYVALGAAGLPVFAGGKGGAAVLVGPTGGYLLGFVLAAAVGALIAGAAPSLARQALAAGVMIVVINGLGTLWLAYSAHLSLAVAAAAGALPFLAGDLLKAAAALAVARRLKKGALARSQ